MPEEVFDLPTLAKYLHLSIQQVEKLVKRDEIPSRRIGGELRFSRAEVHQWMESRMGLLDDAGLAAVESQMQDEGDAAVEELNLHDILLAEAIAVPLVARTKNSVIAKMTEMAMNTGMLWDAEKMAAAIKAREDLQSTAMDNGVAILHPRRPQTAILAEGFLALGITSQGIPFGGSRHLTDVFWLVCSIDDRMHLQTLARLSRLLVNETFLESLRACAGPTDVKACIAEYESSLD